MYKHKFLERGAPPNRFLGNLRNIQYDKQYKSGLLNIIKIRKSSLDYSNFDIENYHFLVDVKLL